VKTLTRSMINVDLVLDDRQPPPGISILIKAIGTLWTSAFLAGLTGDVWLAAMILVGYPAAWSVAWLISDSK
jgi:hypothetical protein